MQELEKILEEIKSALKEIYLDIANNYDISDLSFDDSKVACVASKFRCTADDKVEKIIHKHIFSKDTDITNKCGDCSRRKWYQKGYDDGKKNDGWIPVEKFGLPHSNEHDFRFWVTIQYTNGFRHTIKAKWDCFDKCFIHQNGKKIFQDVIAYKYYSAPEPYRPERSDNYNRE